MLAPSTCPECILCGVAVHGWHASVWAAICPLFLSVQMLERRLGSLPASCPVGRGTCSKKLKQTDMEADPSLPYWHASGTVSWDSTVAKWEYVLSVNAVRNRSQQSISIQEPVESSWLFTWTSPSHTSTAVAQETETGHHAQLQQWAQALVSP